MARFVSEKKSEGGGRSAVVKQGVLLIIEVLNVPWNHLDGLSY